MRKLFPYWIRAILYILPFVEALLYLVIFFVMSINISANIILAFVHGVLNPVIYFTISKNISANIVRQVAEFVVKLGGTYVEIGWQIGSVTGVVSS